MGGRWSVAYRIHDAQWYGVPQRRRRISVVADFGGSTAHEILFEPCGLPGNTSESGTARERPAGASESGAGRTGESIAQAYGETGVGYWQNGVQTLRAEGENRPSRPSNVVVCSIGNDQSLFCMATQQGGAEILANDKATRFRGGGDTRKNDGAGNGLGVGKDGDPAPTLTSADKHIVAEFKSGQGAKAGGIGYQEEVSPTLSAGSNQVPAIFDMSHANDVIRECGEVVPSLQARMGTGGNQVPLTYAFQSSFALSESDVASTQSARQYKSPTDLVYAVDCRNFTENSDINGTLQAKESGGSSLNLNNVCRQSGAVRRLTPLECTRLQGFPDGWVDIGEWTDEKGRVHKEADAPKYKALGNSIALPFWKWLLRRISEYLPEGSTLGSLFDGIGGFPLCWAEIHGAENCRWSSEIEPFPIAVVKRHFGDEDANIVGDIDKFLRGGSRWKQF